MSDLITDEIVEAAAQRVAAEHGWSALTRDAARTALEAAALLIAARALEGMRAEVATWHVYETRDIGDAFRADAVVDLIQGRLDGLAKEGRG